MAGTDDWALLQRYAHQRDERAFETLARRYVDLVYSAAVRRVGDRHLAEDITQAVFVILARKARSIGQRTPLSPWLLRTTKLVARNAIKMESRRRRHEQAAQAISPSASGACSSDPSEVLIWQEIASSIDDAVLRLPSLDRRAVLLRFFRGQSVQAVAAELQISEGAAKRRLGRATGKLRRRLERRGIGVGSVDAAAFAALLSNHVRLHAPARLAGGICAAASGATGGAGVMLAKGAIQMMTWAKVKMTVFVVAGIALAGGASVALSQRKVSQQPAPGGVTAAVPHPAAPTRQSAEAKAIIDRLRNYQNSIHSFKASIKHEDFYQLPNGKTFTVGRDIKPQYEIAFAGDDVYVREQREFEQTQVIIETIHSGKSMSWQRNGPHDLGTGEIDGPQIKPGLRNYLRRPLSMAGFSDLDGVLSCPPDAVRLSDGRSLHQRSLGSFTCPDRRLDRIALGHLANRPDNTCDRLNGQQDDHHAQRNAGDAHLPVSESSVHWARAPADHYRIRATSAIVHRVFSHDAQPTA